jgi:predicted SAM-dependent methyltransferase
MTFVRASDGTGNLHLWREGEEYLRQKGHVFLKQWNNVIFATSQGPPLENTRYLDLGRAQLPFFDAAFDSVYANHVFEHFTPDEARRCLSEVFRVLKPGSTIRVSVPDLETGCNTYLRDLAAAWDRPTPDNITRYR